VKLVLVGINHFDPLCKESLARTLIELRNCYGLPPAFVAVEWDESLFSKVCAQRAAFREKCRLEWPDAGEETLKVLEASLGFEGDTHREVFGDLQTLWLDQGRQGNVENYASQRFVMYKDFLREKTNKDCPTMLSKLSVVARHRQGRLDAGTQRDQKWEELLLERLSKGPGLWAICVIGAGHIANIPGGIRTRLEAKGQQCEIVNL